MKKFLEKNYKLIVSICIGIGIFFILKLWWIGMDVRGSGSGGYIDLSIGWTFDYYWISASYIALFLLIISFIGIFKIYKTKDKFKKIFIAFIILFMGLIGKQVFFIVSPDFKFYLTPVNHQYMDEQGYIYDVDSYLDLFGKYCLDQKHYRIGNCNSKYGSHFKTTEDYIKVFEFAKNNNSSTLYKTAYGGVDDFGIDRILENYNDETFIAFALEKTSNLDLLILLSKYIDSTSPLKDIINMYIDSIIKFEQLNLSQDEGYEYWDTLSKDIDMKIESIEAINYNIFK